MGLVMGECVTLSDPNMESPGLAKPLLANESGWCLEGPKWLKCEAACWVMAMGLAAALFGRGGNGGLNSLLSN
jgi:hypothetical protein